MKKNDLFKKNGIIYRILYLDDPRVLLIDCFKKSFPKWFYNEFLDNVILVTEDELLKETGVDLFELTNEEQAEAQRIWKTIANIVLVIHKDTERRII